jgi:hypothetical protein
VPGASDSQHVVKLMADRVRDKLSVSPPPPQKKQLVSVSLNLSLRLCNSVLLRVSKQGTAGGGPVA